METFKNFLKTFTFFLNTFNIETSVALEIFKTKNWSKTPEAAGAIDGKYIFILTPVS